MHSLLARRGPLLGFVAGATVLLTASAAFACTTTSGKIIITGINATGSATYQGNGLDENDSSGGYCTPPTRLSLTNAAATLDFNLTVSAASCTAGIPVLPAGNYEVRWVKSPTVGVQIDGTAPKCHKERVDTGSGEPVRSYIPLGDITVNATGSTTKPFSLKTAAFRGPGNICLAETGVAQVAANDPFFGTSNIVAPVVFINWAGAII